MALKRRKWLIKVFDSEYFMFWMAIKCLRRYREKGIHAYLCFKTYQTKKKEIPFFLPQLAHLMLEESGRIWNRPIFLMLYKIGIQQKHFSLAFAMYLLATAEAFLPGDARRKVCLEAAGAMARAEKARNIRKAGSSGLSRRTKKKVSTTSLYQRHLITTFGSKVGNSPDTRSLLHQQKQYYNLIQKRKNPFRKEKKSDPRIVLAAFLFGVCAAISNDQALFLKDICMFFRVPAVSPAMPSEVGSGDIDNVSRKLRSESGEFRFISRLNEISTALVPVPRHLRSQALATELNLLNLHLPEPVCFSVPCNGRHSSVLRVSSSASKVLDSAARAPFLLVYECAEDSSTPPQAAFSLSPGADSGGSAWNYAAEEREEEERKEEMKKEMLKTAIKILGDLTDLSSSSHVDLDISAIKARVIGKIYGAHSHSLPSRPKPGAAREEDEEWHSLIRRVEERTPYRQVEKWALRSLIVKTGSDMKQEQFATQILGVIQNIWALEKVDLCIQTYTVVVTGRFSALIETLKTAKSIHQIKKKLQEKEGPGTLGEYFKEKWGDKSEPRENFFRSAVGYSLVSHLLQIKDRHNGNILIDGEGRMVHIDFGFVLGAHPGFYAVESAPFKFSPEYAAVIGAERMSRFEAEFLKGFIALRKHSESIVTLVESLDLGSGTFGALNGNSADSLSQRFCPGMTEEEFLSHTSEVVSRGLKSVFTEIYDSLQYYTQGYCK